MNSCQWLRQMLLGHVRNLDVSVLVGDMHIFVLWMYYIFASLQVHIMCARSSEKKIEQKKILIYLSILLSLTISAHRHEHALIHQMYSKQKIRQTNSSSTRYTRMLPQLTFIRPNHITPLGVHSRKVVGQFQVFPRRLVVNSWLEQKKSSFKRGLSHYEGGWILWNHFLDELERGSLGERERSFFPCYRHELNKIIGKRESEYSKR
jgi:hypothetical protein